MIRENYHHGYHIHYRYARENVKDARLGICRFFFFTVKENHETLIVLTSLFSRSFWRYGPHLLLFFSTQAEVCSFHMILSSQESNNNSLVEGDCSHIWGSPRCVKIALCSPQLILVIFLYTYTKEILILHYSKQCMCPFYLQGCICPKTAF